jgi:hypothetical protein
MKKIGLMVSVILLSAHFMFADTVSVKGTVKNGTGTGIAGVKVTLIKNKGFATTDAQGAFTIVGGVSTYQLQSSFKPQFQFSLAGNLLVISPAFEKVSGCVDIFSSNGKKNFSIPFIGNKAGKQTVNLPNFVSGLSIVRVSIGSETITRSLVCLGNSNMYLKSEVSNVIANDNFSLAKIAATTALDTIIATKTGYIDKKVAIDSYKKDGVTITLDTSPVGPSACTTPDPKLPAASAITYSNAKHPSPWDFKYMNLPRVATKADWACRRQEIYLMAQEYLYGHMPPKCEVTGTVSGGKITANCKYNGKTAAVTINASGSGDILVLCFGGMGCASVPGARSVNVDGASFLATAKSLYGSTDMGICMASAWGAGRIIDALEQNPTAGIDPKKVVTTGCSTNGKQALFAGVFEPRVGLCAPVESGAAGACSWRVSSNYGHGNTDTDCQDITHLETNWLGTVADPWTKGNPKIDKLPLDQGEIMALRAPGAMISFDNGKEQYKWLCNRGNTAAAQGCHWIYKALGIEDNFGFYQANAGHGHCSWPSEATPPLNAFIDKFLKGKTDANTHVFNYNKESMDTQKWFDFGTAKEQWDTTLTLK